MEPQPSPASAPLPRPPAISDLQIYRPGPLLAVSILLLPILVALIGAAFFLGSNATIPGWFPFIFLIWLPCAPLLWFALQSVRVSSIGLAVGRPWSAWIEAPWDLIERAEQTGPLLRLSISDGRRLLFAPRLLQDGQRIRRDLVLRLPAHILSGSLASDLPLLQARDIVFNEDGLSGVLHAYPRPRWSLSAGFSALIAFTLAVLAVLILPPILGVAFTIVLAALLLILAGASAFAFNWLTQEVRLDEKGLTVTSRILRRTNAITWREVMLVEHSPREYLLRLRGSRRLFCPGPSFMPPAARDLMRAFIHEYCTSRDIPSLNRTTWPF